MEINLITIIGLVAAICTTVSLLPQAIKVIKIKKTRDISLKMYIILAIGAFCWFIYGIFIGSLLISFANIVVFLFAIIILIFKIKYK